MALFQAKSHVGDKFNRLSVIDVRHVTKTFRTGLVRRLRELKVRCECGREKWMRSEHVTAGRAKSCGCLNYEPRCSDPHLRASRRVLAYLRGSARARDLLFSINVEDVQSKVFGPCYYCGCAPTRSIGEPRPYAGRNPLCHGLDRVDSSRGYEPNNVVACCFQCNMMKWELTKEEFFAHVEKIAARLPLLRQRKEMMQ